MELPKSLQSEAVRLVPFYIVGYNFCLSYSLLATCGMTMGRSGKEVQNGLGFLVEDVKVRME